VRVGGGRLMRLLVIGRLVLLLSVVVVQVSRRCTHFVEVECLQNQGRIIMKRQCVSYVCPEGLQKRDFLFCGGQAERLGLLFFLEGVV